MKKLLILNLVLASAGIVFAQDFFELLATGTPGQVRTAIKAGLDVNADLGDGYTSLMIAAAYNTNPEVITILLKAGANVNFQMRDGKTPLMKAASYNPNPEVITILLKAGANMDHQDYYGATALMYAAGSSNPEVFTILLSAGADGTLKDKSGKTAFDLAKENPALGGTDPYTKVYDLSQADFSKDPVPLPSSFPAKLAGMSEEEITAIALKYHGQGNYRESLNHFYYTTMIKPEAALGYFNMACAYSLLGYLGSSAEYLEIAFQNDETWTLSVIEDTDLNNLRPTSLFREIVSQHGKND